jgi:predicted nucleotidyltransferase
MQKVSTAKKTEQVLNEEIKSSVKEALKDAHFKETGAGAKFAEESTRKRMKQIGRAEVFKEEDPEFMGRGGTEGEIRLYKKLVKALEESAKKLKEELGDNFIGLVLVGSYDKGFAGKRSDVDLRMLVKRESGTEKAEATVTAIVNNAGIKEVEFATASLEEAIIKIKKSETGPYEDDAAIEVLCFFAGRVFGNSEKIYNARKEIVQELANGLWGEAVWELVDEKYRRNEVRLEPNSQLVRTKLGVSGRDYKEILKAREKFALPTFEEMKKKYGVA